MTAVVRVADKAEGSGGQVGRTAEEEEDMWEVDACHTDKGKIKQLMGNMLGRKLAHLVEVDLEKQGGKANGTNIFEN